ncbi:ABCE1 homolog [Aeropyrum pernix]|uniref:ABCE1 homolog n=1 Tax=Aeropyrum pernix TaxID=56636 RepID=A0A401H8I2_AERPX|nr:ribosome biogenesis/translation initiation ATPase RLI [Aeropyrum pernix]GBF08776.1 ABCE1 homolog [Aeropyrum pernix]
MQGGLRLRLAVIDYDSCKPKKCSYECIAVCPVNKSGRGVAIDADMASRGKPVIYEDACIGCALCVKACPFDAIYIVNLPMELEEEAVHRYGVNGFKLFRLPIPREGQVVGLLGRNGTGKTTALRILAGELKPNLGRVEGGEPEWDEILKRFRGSELQTYFKRLVDGKLRVAHKIQYVELVPRRLKGRVRDLLKRADERGVALELAEQVGLDRVFDRDVRQLSGGELQKMLIVAVLSRDANVYIFDEPSSYLDIRERMRMARLIAGAARPGAYVMVVEHDLAVLDYVSDLVHILYGEPGAYGIVSKPYSTREGINVFLQGYLPAENIRLRKEPILFRKPAPEAQPATPGGGRQASRRRIVGWTGLKVALDGFTLTSGEGALYGGEVIGVAGPNGIGKTTFVKTLAGALKPVEGAVYPYVEDLRVSYKPQYISPESLPDATVEQVLKAANPAILAPGSWLNLELVKRMRLDKLLERRVRTLSGGELQKVAVAAALAREADVYLLDEPSAYLDVEERVGVARAIRRIVETREAAALVVEHDLMILDYVSDRIMLVTGEPGVRGHVDDPRPVKEGMNLLLQNLGVTVRKDEQTGRPRLNKEGSYLDRMQRARKLYYAV